MIWAAYITARPRSKGGLEIRSTRLSALTSTLFSAVVLVAQSCPTLCDPMDCSPPGSSVRGLLQARRLQWVTSPFLRRYSQPRASCISGRFFTIWATRDYQYKWCVLLLLYFSSNLFSVFTNWLLTLAHPWCNVVGHHFLWGIGSLSTFMELVWESRWLKVRWCYYVIIIMCVSWNPKSRIISLTLWPVRNSLTVWLLQHSLNKAGNLSGICFPWNSK